MTTKRLFDLALSVALLALTSPVLIGVGIAVKLEDGGPVFYRGPRVGMGGKPFRIFKFRSMVVGADRLGASSTSGSDQRVTRTGRFIRRFKLDELVQLLNVVSGDMSLVGPRPEVQKFVDLFTDEETEILRVRPGITDWASIWNNDEGGVIARSGIADADEAYLRLIRPTKLKLQLKYVRERTFWMDVRILARTTLAVLGPRHDVSDIAPPPLATS